jgi:hypothetical protein
VVAIAPIDGQYKPTGRETVLENLNYLVLHGAHDMDVVSFSGARQYARVRFTDGGNWFKAGLYIYGANHGQFNTSWGRKDLFEPLMRVFNLRQLMPAEQQEQIAKVYISAFLEATLRGESGYLPLFRDHHIAREWLPDTIYLSQYDDATTRPVSTYQEDINVATTTLPGGAQLGVNLAVWRERLVKAKWGDMDNHAVYLGWDTDALPATACYAIQLPYRALTLTHNSILVFALADANEDPTPETKDERGKGPREPIDLTVEVVDGAGEVARLPLSHFSFLQPQLAGRIGKAAFMSPLPVSEVVFQHFEFPMTLVSVIESNGALHLEYGQDGVRLWRYEHTPPENQTLYPAAAPQPGAAPALDRAIERGPSPQTHPHLRPGRLWQDDAAERVGESASSRISGWVALRLALAGQRGQ